MSAQLQSVSFGPSNTPPTQLEGLDPVWGTSLEYSAQPRRVLATVTLGQEQFADGFGQTSGLRWLTSQASTLCPPDL